MRNRISQEGEDEIKNHPNLLPELLIAQEKELIIHRFCNNSVLKICRLI